MFTATSMKEQQTLYQYHICKICVICVKLVNLYSSVECVENLTRQIGLVFSFVHCIYEERTAESFKYSALSIFHCGV